MRFQNRNLFVLLLLAAAGIFAFSPCSAKADSMSAGRKAVMAGAKQMLKGNQMIMKALAKKGVKNADLETAQKQMNDGYNMVVKGNSMMTGSTMSQGQDMMKKGAAMMLAAQNTTNAIVHKNGWVKTCAVDLHECHYAKQKIEHGAAMWYFGGVGF